MGVAFELDQRRDAEVVDEACQLGGLIPFTVNGKGGVGLVSVVHVGDRADGVINLLEGPQLGQQNTGCRVAFSFHGLEWRRAAVGDDVDVADVSNA
ncbi:hypothetical protein BJQ90_02346 [Arthrobacter sp. SO3]|nr:hypothetical protein [Arthrobacter sp. SO3]